MAGLTLGGGFGWLTRKYGMTIDNLVSADVTLASGEQVRTGADENPDLTRHRVRYHSWQRVGTRSARD